MDKSLKQLTDDELLEKALKMRLEVGCSPKEEKEIRSAMNKLHKERYGLCCDVPNNRCCYFCLKEKTGLHEHKVRQETYGGAILGGMIVNVHTYSYQVCGDCQKKLWVRGTLMLLCASLLGGVAGLILSLLMKFNHSGVERCVISICVVCYLFALLSLFNRHGQVRMNILWLIATVLFLAISGPIILHLFSFSTTLGICSLMAFSFPTILLGLYQYINLFTKLYGRPVY